MVNCTYLHNTHRRVASDQAVEIFLLLFVFRLRGVRMQTNAQWMGNRVKINLAHVCNEIKMHHQSQSMHCDEKIYEMQTSSSHCYLPVNHLHDIRLNRQLTAITKFKRVEIIFVWIRKSFRSSFSDDLSPDIADTTFWTAQKCNIQWCYGLASQIIPLILIFTRQQEVCFAQFAHVFKSEEMNRCSA